VTQARVSGLGPVPGESVSEAAKVIAGECGLAAFVPILSQRGPGADPVGRTAGLLSRVSSDFGIVTVPSGWRLSGSPGRDMVRARSFLSADFDALEEQFQGFTGSLTMSIVGPVSWAGAVEGPRGEKLIRDHGALRDISIALSDVVAETAVDLSRRFSGATLTIQIDEPLVMPATSGAIPTASAFRTYVALDRQLVASLWSPLFAAAQLHGAGFGVNATGGQVALSDPYISLLQAAHVTRFYHIESARELGEVIESGAETVWIAPPSGTGTSIASDIADRIGSLGFEVSNFAPSVIIVPSDECMNAGWERARHAWNRARSAVDLLNDPDRLVSR